MSPRRLRRTLLASGLLVVLCSIATLALASQRIASEQAAFRAPAAGRCLPSTLNRSAQLPGTPLLASPLPGSYDASPRTQISLLGAPASALAHVRVRGSLTGSHRGRLRAYSQGDGASYVLAQPFIAGETVTVRGSVKVGARAPRFAFHFVVAHLDRALNDPPAHASVRHPNQVQHFHSRPDLQPPSISVTARSPQTASGYVIADPYAGAAPGGPMIFDEAGNLVWFQPMRPPAESANLQVQSYHGQPVLTWWQGHIPQQGFGQGEEVILNGSYHLLGRVHAGNGFKADLHDFHLTAQNTALLTVFSPVYCNLSALGGPRGGAVTDSVFQEVDLPTGLVRREWHSLDHIGLGASYSSATSTSTEWPFDYFHINSIDQEPNGLTLISARNTWALYQLNTATGVVQSSIGGKHSGVKLQSSAHTAFQHDAELLPNGMISLFDNGAVPKVHPQSRGIVLSLQPQANTASVVAQYEHPTPLSSGSQGNLQILPNGDVFVGWGAEPYFSEFDSAGALLFDAHMHGSYESYRGYRSPWTGTPGGAPAIAATGSAGGPVTAYASWNGDTQTVAWRLLAGPSAQQLAPVASAPRAGFETAITTGGPAPYVAVQALDSAGNVLGTSRTIAG